MDIENIAGSIQVTGWDRNEVEITGYLGRGAEEIEIDSDGDSISIEVVLRSGRHVNVEGTDLELRVPHGIELAVCILGVVSHTTCVPLDPATKIEAKATQ